MKTVWEMTQKEREALWAANDSAWKPANEQWDLYNDWFDFIEEKLAIEGPAFDC